MRTSQGCGPYPVLASIEDTVVHVSEVTLLIWMGLLVVVSSFAPLSYPSGASPLIRALTHPCGALHRPTFQNSRSTRRERRNQSTQSVSLIR